MSDLKNSHVFLKAIASLTIVSTMLGNIAFTKAYAENTPLSTSTAEITSGKIFEIEMSDKNPLYTLKKEIIQEYIDKNPLLNIQNVDMNASTIQANSFDRSKSGLQTLKASLSIVIRKGENQTTTYSYAETATVKLKQSQGPQIVLKANEMRLDLGGTFNYADNLGIVSTVTGSLPVLTESDNVDPNTEGTYTVNITAIDQQGLKSNSSFTVVVAKSEVLPTWNESAMFSVLQDGSYTDSEFRSLYLDEMTKIANEGDFRYYFAIAPYASIQCTDLTKYLFYKKYGMKSASANGKDVVQLTAAMYPSQFVISSTPQEGVFFSTRNGTVYGHTGYINKIEGDTIWISEANVSENGKVMDFINHPISLQDFMNRGVHDFLIPVNS